MPVGAQPRRSAQNPTASTYEARCVAPTGARRHGQESVLASPTASAEYPTRLPVLKRLDNIDVLCADLARHGAVLPRGARTSARAAVRPRAGLGGLPGRRRDASSSSSSAAAPGRGAFPAPGRPGSSRSPSRSTTSTQAIAELDRRGVAWAAEVVESRRGTATAASTTRRATSCTSRCPTARRSASTRHDCRCVDRQSRVIDCDVHAPIALDRDARFPGSTRTGERWRKPRSSAAPPIRRTRRARRPACGPTSPPAAGVAETVDDLRGPRARPAGRRGRHPCLPTYCDRGDQEPRCRRRARTAANSLAGRAVAGTRATAARVDRRSGAHPQLAAEEIERCAVNPAFVQVLLPVRSFAPYGNRIWWPLLEAVDAPRAGARTCTSAAPPATHRRRWAGPARTWRSTSTCRARSRRRS